MDITFWKSIRNNDFAVPDGYTSQQLTPELLDYLGSPDPELRDDFTLPILAYWMYRDHYTLAEKRGMIARLGENLTQGIGESALAELIKDWENNLPENMKLAYLPQPGLVRLRITAYGESRERTAAEVEAQAESLQKLIPGLIYGYGKDTMEEIVGRLLKEKHLTLSTAESCTGGYLAHLITSVPGSSDYFTGSVIAYSNRIKQEFLGVAEKSLISFGAVSEEVVREMAEGARKRLNTDIAVSISGIAGPDGGTAEKPVGTVWIAVANKTGITAKKFMFGEHRGRNIRRAALAALNLVRVELMTLRREDGKTVRL